MIDSSPLVRCKQLLLWLIEMMKRGGFGLTKIVSNRKEVIDALPSSEIAPNVSFDIDTNNIQRALGVSWDVVLDQFTFSFSPPDAPVTKRGILRVVSTLFDPLGFLTPFVVRAKILLQELWRKKYDWDEDIDEQAASYWQRWLDAASDVVKVRVDRCYISDAVSEIQLHIFSDASESAYGSVAYFRFSFKSGGHSCALIMSKSKLAPIRSVSLPRLEFEANVTGVRLYKTT